MAGVDHTHQVLHHVSDTVAMFREMRRVAKPHGLVAAREVDYEVLVLAPRIPEEVGVVCHRRPEDPVDDRCPKRVFDVVVQAPPPSRRLLFVQLLARVHAGGQSRPLLVFHFHGFLTNSA